MALDYTMTRDALNSAVQSNLLRANRIGQSAAQLGYLGSDALGLGQGGLFNLLKGLQNPFTQESIEDPNRIYGGSNYEVDSVNYKNPEATQALINSISPEGVSEEIPKALDEMYAPEQVISSEPVGNMVGGSYNTLPDGSFEFMPADDSSINMYQPGQQPGVDQGVLMNTGPINTAIAQDKYVVQPGDTSFDIKNKYNMTMQDLANQNFDGNLESAKSIYPGDTLKVNPINTALSNELTTDEDFLNQNLDMLWNSGTPNDTTGSFIPMQGDFPVPNWDGESTQKKRNPLMDLIRRIF